MTLVRIESADPGYRSPFVVDPIGVRADSQAWLYHRDAFASTGSERHYEWMLEHVTLDVPEMAPRLLPAVSSVRSGYHLVMCIMCIASWALIPVLAVSALAQDSLWSLAVAAFLTASAIYQSEAWRKRVCS